MNPVCGLLRADVAGQTDLGEQRRSVTIGGVHGGQRGERGPELDPAGGEPLADLLAGDPVRVCAEQAGDVMGGRPTLVIGRPQGRDRLTDPLAILVGLYGELGHARTLDRRHGGDLGAVVEQHQLLELDVGDDTTRVGRAEQGVGGGESHLAVGGARVGGDVVDLVVGQPWQFRRAHIALPGVPLGLLRQPDVLTE